MKTHSIILAILLFSCTKDLHQPSEKQKSINHVRKKAAYSIKNKYGLIPCGTGGQAMEEIEMLALMFDYRQATVNFRMHHVNYLSLHGVLTHGTQTFKN